MINNTTRAHTPPQINVNSAKNELQSDNRISQEVAAAFIEIARVFSILSVVSFAAALGSQFVPGAQLALVPLMAAGAVCLAVAAIIGASGYVIKALASKSSTEPNNSLVNVPAPSDSSLLDYKQIPELITLKDEIARAQVVKKTYFDLQEKHPGLELMTKNLGLQTPNGGQGLWLSFNMRGLSVVASELKAKHQLEHLYVCESLEALQSKLLEISKSEADVKAAMIVPTRYLVSWAKNTPESQHKSTVCVEKKDGKLKIMYIDSQPQDVDETLVKKPISELENLDGGEGHASFMAFWAIYHSGIDMSKVELSRFMHTREHAHFGCETFALKDSVAFLKTDNFFDKVVKDPTPRGSKIGQVIGLPADFMKTTQSLAQVEKYAQEYPALAKQNLVRRDGKTPRTLQEAVKIRTKKGYNKHNQKVDQNHYTTMFSLKYHKMLLDAMANMETQAIKNKIDSTFVHVERPLLKHGETPKTINDLFNKWNCNFSDSPPEGMSFTDQLKQGWVTSVGL